MARLFFSSVRLLLFITALAAPGHAQTQPAHDPYALPGMGPEDARKRVDMTIMPWRAVGKIQANAGNIHLACTGALIGPREVLTAAHCLLNPRTRVNFPASSLHFLLAFESGRYTGHAVGTSFIAGNGKDRTDDWAVLTLAEPVAPATDALRLANRPPEVGENVMIGGYNQDHALILRADVNCKVTKIIDGPDSTRFIQHDCEATHGASGAPLFIRQEGEWRIAAIATAALSGSNGGFAVAIRRLPYKWQSGEP
jgi:protease YdgD